MKSLFRNLFVAAVSAAVSLAALWSCTTNEKYDFSFTLPGHIVTELESTVVIPITARNITSVSVTSTPKGWTVEDVDLQNWTVTVKAPSAYTADDPTVEENGTLKLSGFTPAGTSVTASSYLSLLNLEMDLSDKYSNCYVISQKDTRYTIDVTHKGESSETFTPDNVEVLWQSDRELVNYTSYYADKGTFTFFISHTDITDDNDNVIDSVTPDGNAVVAAYDSAGNIIWSWHIWITGSDVESTAITTSAGVFMDRNLGAYHNSDGSTDTDDIFKSYGLYYQWGRKDPFIRPVDYNFSNNEDNLWSSEQKSIYDPCPRGWRIPDGNAFVGMDIDQSEDLSELGDIRGMYGWHLVDTATGTKIFMPGAGRRSFENGKLTNVNNYGYENTPMPWVGYYWTAGIATSDRSKAQSMFFDLNTTRAVNNRYEPQKEMYRANAMQIRCVREE